jgi:catechol 2,3-dioxygenase-like lactoylglutathione lyase family enzyme
MTMSSQVEFPARLCTTLSRRKLPLSLLAIAAAPGLITGLLAQARKRQIQLQTLNHATITVADVQRSTEFYQGLFGMPIQARQGALPSLRIGAGPQFIFLGGGGANPKPGIHHLCVTTDHFDVTQILGILAEHGFVKDDNGVMASGPFKVHVRMRPENLGGAPQGTAELSIGDPDGIIVQIQDTRYAGGAGRLGEVAKIEPSPAKGLIAVRDISHFTLDVSDVQRSRAFYQDLFGMPIQARQGATPVLAVGSKREFLALAGSGAAGGPPRKPGINHLCLTMENFNADRVLKTLAGFGVRPRGDMNAPAGPLVSWVVLRKEDRGGSKEGTPELYFTDPDGLTMQLQDVKYCGGSGRLGEVCSG